MRPLRGENRPAVQAEPILALTLFLDPIRRLQGGFFVPVGSCDPDTVQISSEGSAGSLDLDHACFLFWILGRSIDSTARVAVSKLGGM